MRIVVLALSAFTALAAPAEAEDPSRYLVTIQSVSLKREDGTWLTVSQPDHPVDLVNQEAAVAFFNNGRVPSGKYVNFRLILSNIVFCAGEDARAFRTVLSSGKKVSPDGIEISAVKDFASVELRKNSFIRVFFLTDVRGLFRPAPDGSWYCAPPLMLRQAGLTLDTQEVSLGPQELALQY